MTLPTSISNSPLPQLAEPSLALNSTTIGCILMAAMTGHMDYIVCIQAPAPICRPVLIPMILATLMVLTTVIFQLAPTYSNTKPVTGVLTPRKTTL
jgi:hypothetical protein